MLAVSLLTTAIAATGWCGCQNHDKMVLTIVRQLANDVVVVKLCLLIKMADDLDLVCSLFCPKLFHCVLNSMTHKSAHACTHTGTQTDRQTHTHTHKAYTHTLTKHTHTHTEAHNHTHTHRGTQSHTHTHFRFLLQKQKCEEEKERERKETDRGVCHLKRVKSLKSHSSIHPSDLCFS